MQTNNVKRLTVAMHRICVRGIPRKIQPRSRRITAKIIPVTVITAGFSSYPFPFPRDSRGNPRVCTRYRTRAIL